MSEKFMTIMFEAAGGCSGLDPTICSEFVVGFLLQLSFFLGPMT